MNAAIHPLISVIITTMNRTELLPVALASLRRQDFREFEVVVVNDGGEDVRPVLEPFRESLRITAVQNERNLGVAAARNRGLAAAKGRYIAYLDDDDFYYEDHLRLLVEVLQGTGAAVVYTDANKALQKREDGVFVTVSRRVVWSVDFDAQKLCVNNFIPTLCMIHEKACIDLVGGFREYLDRHEDWELWQRMSRFYNFAHVRGATAEFLVCEGGVSLSKNTAAMERSRLHVRQLGDCLKTMPRVIDLEARLKNAVFRRRYSAKNASASVIVYIDGADPRLAECLDTLADYPQGTERILCVDGDPKTAELLAASLGGDMTIIEHPERVGRVLALNHAAENAEGETLLFLGQDVLLDAAVFRIMEKVRSARGGIATTRLQGPDGALLCGGTMDDTGRLRHREITAETEAGGRAEDGIASVLCANAACFMAGKELFTRLKGFSRRYAPGGYEDADFCLRARRDAGEQTHVIPAAAQWSGANAGVTPSEALYGAATFGAEWAKEPGRIPRREYWIKTSSVQPNTKQNA